MGCSCCFPRGGGWPSHPTLPPQLVLRLHIDSTSTPHLTTRLSKNQSPRALWIPPTKPDPTSDEKPNSPHTCFVHILCAGCALEVFSRPPWFRTVCYTSLERKTVLVYNILAHSLLLSLCLFSLAGRLQFTQTDRQSSPGAPTVCCTFSRLSELQYASTTKIVYLVPTSCHKERSDIIWDRGSGNK